MLVTLRIASWSLIPEIDSRRLTEEGRLVKRMSSVFSFLVGKSVILERPRISSKSSICLFITLRY